MKNPFRIYKYLDRSFFALYAVQFLQNLIQTSFLLIFNIYLLKNNYTDADAGTFISLQYLGLLILALPLGIIMRGRRLKPVLWVSTLGVPVASLMIIYAVPLHHAPLNYALNLLWGMCFAGLQIVMLPYVMRNVSSHIQTEAIAFMYTNYSAGQILSGLLVAGLTLWGGWNEFEILRALALGGLLGSVLMFWIKEKKNNNPQLDSQKIKSASALIHNYDWRMILTTMIPNTMLTIGAGLTFPFMNIFFYNSFHLDSDGYGILNTITAVLVLLSTLTIPFIHKRYGFKVSISLSQTIAVGLLVLLAVTDLFRNYTWAFYGAWLFFALRQPFMQAAVPMTRELMMLYVGERNREIISALLSGIRSGSYFFSGLVFSQLRAFQLPYAFIFLMTAGFYAIGVVAYHQMILAYEHRAEH